MNLYSLLAVLTIILAVNAKSMVEKSPPISLEEYYETYEEYDETRIINGQSATQGQFPHQVFILIELNVTPKDYGGCGGALISSKHILTAAHCIIGGISFKIKLGATILETYQAGQLVIATTNGIPHPGFNKFTNNDIGIITLPNEIQFTDLIKPIRLPRRSEINDKMENIDLITCGWGNTTSNSGRSNTLNWTTLKSIPNNQCTRFYSPNVIVPTTLCCVGPAKQSTCDGDSGGGLIRKDADGQYTHVGVTSFVTTAGCDKGNPVGFTRTVNYLDWINNITGIPIRP